MEVAGRSAKNDYIGILRHFLHCTFCSYLCLCNRVRIYGTGTCQHGIVAAAVQIILMSRRIRRDYRDSCVCQLLYIGRLCRIIVRLHDDQVVLFCDTVLQKSVLCIVICFSADAGQFDVVITCCRSLHLRSQPCRERIRAGTCHKADTIGIFGCRGSAFLFCSVCTLRTFCALCRSSCVCRIAAAP